jgi:hypothetical protein
MIRLHTTGSRTVSNRRSISRLRRRDLPILFAALEEVVHFEGRDDRLASLRHGNLAASFACDVVLSHVVDTLLTAAIVSVVACR